MTIIDFIKNNEFLVKLLMAAAELGVGFMLAPIVRRWILSMTKMKVDEAILTFTSSAVSILIKFLAIVIALAQIGVDMTVVVGAFSAVGLGVSLALKENMANVAGGLQILITRPFRVGDYIAMGDYEGTCTRVEIMFTILQTADRQEVIIPNSSLVSNTIVNYSEYPVRRVVIPVPVATNADYDGLRQSFSKLMETDSRVLKTPESKTVFSGFTDSGNGSIIKLVCYCRNCDYWDLLYDLNAGVQKTLASENALQPVDCVQVVK